jgi:photosystem II stability/assembly factor-like uncharacterized protein
LGWSAATVLCVASAVRAHAPTPRRVALNQTGTSVALSLPGFGILFRAHEGQPFSYLCDALMAQKPSELAPDLAFLADGSLLVASADGVRIVSPDGCPRADAVSELATASVVALAVQRGAAETVYAVASGSAAGVWRSADGGKHWQKRAALAESQLASALVVSKSDPERIYLSLRGSPGAMLLASTDGGASFSAFTQEPTLSLLSADGPAPYPLWAIARDALTVGNRGSAIMRAAAPSGPWQTVLRVNYFGGFVVDERGVIWVGDEIGGVYRSDDGGESFDNLQADADVACLASAADGLWACTPGTLQEPALQRFALAQPRSDVVTFAAVDRLVSCPELDVASTCSAAWLEWQRDVRLLPVENRDAGVPAPSEAGTEREPGGNGQEPEDPAAAGDAAQEEAEGEAAAEAVEPTRHASSGCSIASVTREGGRQPVQPNHAIGCSLGLALLLQRRRRAR